MFTKNKEPGLQITILLPLGPSYADPEDQRDGSASPRAALVPQYDRINVVCQEE
jgi:hypothetical protein